MISSYLQLDKAKHGERIKALDERRNEIIATINELSMQLQSISWVIDTQYLRDHENLHFKDYESAMYYFEELVDDIMSDWNSETKVKEALTDCYIDGILYSPRFDGDKWSLGEDFIELFKLIKCGENYE